MSVIKAPCIDCEERMVGCHGKCGQYKDFQRKRTAMKKARAARYDEETDYLVARRWRGYER